MRARFGDRLDDARPLFLLAPAQLFLELAEAIAGHRDLVHFFNLSCPARLRASRAGHRFPTAKAQKENGPGASATGTASPRSALNIASFARFSRQKLACCGETAADDPAATPASPHCDRIRACARRRGRLCGLHRSSAGPTSMGMKRGCKPMLSRIALRPLAMLAAGSAFAETQQLDAGGIPVNAEIDRRRAAASLGPGFPARRRRDRHRTPRPHAACWSDGKLSEPVAGVPKVAARGQGGLLDVAHRARFRRDRHDLLHLFRTRQGRRRAPRLPAQSWCATAARRAWKTSRSSSRWPRRPRTHASFRLAPRRHARRHAVRHHRRPRRRRPRAGHAGPRRRGDPHQCRRLDPSRQPVARRRRNGCRRSGRRAIATRRARSTTR